MSEAPILENVMMVTKQWDIPHYQDPWFSSETKANNYTERKAAGLTKPMAQPVYCYDTVDKVYIDYPSKLQCAEKINIAITTLRKGIKQGKGIDNRYFVAVSKTWLTQIIQINKFLKGENTPMRILCIDTFDGGSVVYKSKCEAAKMIGYSDKTITWALNHGNLINGRFKVEVVQ